MASKYLKKMLSEASGHSRIFTEKSLNLVDRIQEVLQKKGMTQKDLAEALGKNESEISKWLSVGHNMTLKTIAKIEEVLEAEILIVPKPYDAYKPTNQELSMVKEE